MVIETGSPEETFELGKKIGRPGKSWSGLYTDRRPWNRKDSIYPGRCCGSWDNRACK